MATKTWQLPMRDKSAKSFLRDNRGGVAITFGLAFPVVAFMSLVAVDYSRASSAKQALQEALDAATLMAARSTAMTANDIDTIGDKTLAAQLIPHTDITGLTANGQGRVANATFTPDSTKIIAVANATVEPLVAGVFLDGPMEISAHSEVVRSLNKLEIALVLDTTGSMQGTKLTNLITSAKEFVTTMQTAASWSVETNPVKISVVPFAQTVKVQSSLSMANYNNATFTMTGLPTWLDGRNRAVSWNNDIFTNANAVEANRIDRFRMLKQMGQPWGGCVEARVAPYDIRETAPTSSTLATLFTPYFWPDEPDTDSDYQNDYLTDGTSGQVSGLTWLQRQGRSAKYNTTTFKSGTAAPNTFIPHALYGSPWLYGPNAACNMQAVKRLSTDFEGIKTHIDGLVASGETNVPLGLMWGWHTLSPNAPFADGVAYTTPATTKIIVLMTDGDNTMNDTVGSNNANNSNYHGYGYIWQNKLGTTSSDTGTRTTYMNNRMVPPASNPNQEALCTNIKAKNIQIYSVGVGVSNAAKTLLTACATSSDYYYDVDAQAGNLSAAFSAIAGSIQNLRISH